MERLEEILELLKQIHSYVRTADNSQITALYEVKAKELAEDILAGRLQSQEPQGESEEVQEMLTYERYAEARQGGMSHDEMRRKFLIPNAKALGPWSRRYGTRHK